MNYPITEEFRAENWLYDIVKCTSKSETEFEVEGYEFTIVSSETTHLFKDESVEVFKVVSKDHGENFPMEVKRWIKAGKTVNFEGSEGDINRDGNSVREVISKLVAMCF